SLQPSLAAVARPLRIVGTVGCVQRAAMLGAPLVQTPRFRLAAGALERAVPDPAAPASVDTGQGQLAGVVARLPLVKTARRRRSFEPARPRCSTMVQDHQRPLGRYPLSFAKD